MVCWESACVIFVGYRQARKLIGILDFWLCCGEYYRSVRDGVVVAVSSNSPSRSRVMSGLNKIAGLCFMFASVVGLPVFAESEARTIWVEGHFEMEVEPEFIEWQLDLTDRHVDPVKAKEVNDARLKALFELTKKLDVEKKDVVIGQVGIKRLYKRDNNRNLVFDRYAVTRLIKVRQRDRGVFDEMLSGLAEQKIEFAVSYGSDELVGIKRKVHLAAVQNAYVTAQALAGALGQKVGRPLEIDDYGSGIDGGVNRGGSGGLFGGEDHEAQAQYGSLMVRASVEIRFELLDK